MEQPVNKSNISALIKTNSCLYTMYKHIKKSDIIDLSLNKILTFSPGYLLCRMPDF